MGSYPILYEFSPQNVFFYQYGVSTTYLLFFNSILIKYGVKFIKYGLRLQYQGTESPVENQKANMGILGFLCTKKETVTSAEEIVKNKGDRNKFQNDATFFKFSSGNQSDEKDKNISKSTLEKRKRSEQCGII